jgi:hypothetical protein
LVNYQDMQILPGHTIQIIALFGKMQKINGTP